MTTTPKTIVNDGGPAYPVPQMSTASGISRRDWTAAQVAIGLYAGRQVQTVDPAAIPADATLAYKIADALIAAGKA